MNATAIMPTPNAKRYLGQFCKHFAHKLPVELAEDNTSGQVSFGSGTCLLAADNAKLKLVLDAPEESMAALQDVVVRHLVRFAFREELTVNWENS